MSVDPNRAKSIFLSAVEDHAPEDWGSYLDEACQGDAELRRRVETLLTAHQGTDRLLDGSVVSVEPLDLAEPMEGPGTVIGRYKLLEKIGEGGMAVVYMAEQTEPIRRKVALKIIKLGMDTRQVIARFEAERQALALMDHPSIAKVLDAGATETGRPYFVMELVAGVSITEYCDKNNLSTKDRLVLFLQVCHAVQHAHQKGIIHRDIKPSNVMVTHHDGKPVPKVIDFGIAKATNQKLTEKTLFTRYAHIIGTPAYMSPEQAELSDLDIDTRSDIYSLGVLLYELLTGTTPFSEEELRKAGYIEMQRVIREQEPVKPSTRLSTLGDTLTDVARCRNCTPELLHKAVRGDLDWIVMKALEKDRARRYETANSLMQELQHHLNNEPVLARSPSTAYRFQKLVRRNKGVFAAVGIVAVVLVLGVIVSTWQAARATRAERTQTRLRHEAEALTYASDMSLAQQALATNDLGRALRLLEEHQPKPGEVDLRGWEWRYLWQQCRSDALGELNRYANTAHAVAYSPDGHLLAVAGRVDQFVDIWDVPSRRRIKVLQQGQGQLVAFSPRGDLLATDSGDQILLWQTGTWDPVGQLALKGGPVKVLKFSPDGRRLASLSSPNDVTVWDVDRRPIVPHLHIGGVRCPANNPWVRALDFSPDGEAIVVGDADRRLRVFDLANGTTDVNIPHAHPEPVSAVAWSPQRSVVASGSAETIRLWDAATGNDLGKLEGHTAWISTLIFSADGRWLYSASGDQTIRIWDVEQQRCLAILRGSRDEVWALALAPDGRTLASGGRDGVVALWNAQPRAREEQPRQIPSAVPGWPAFAPAGRVLAVPRKETVNGIDQTTVSLLDLVTGAEVERLPTLGNDVWRIAYSPDGALLVSDNKKGKVRVWSCVERRLLGELYDSNAWFDLLGFRADGPGLVAVGQYPPGKARVIWWDVVTWQAVRTFEVEAFWPALVSPDGRFLAGISRANRRPVLWLSAETGGPLAPPMDAHQQAIQRIAFSGDSLQAASTGLDGTVTLYDLSSFQRIASFRAHMQSAHGAAFSPDGRRLATGGNEQDVVKLWDLSTRREIMTLPGEVQGLMQNLAFSPDGRWLVAHSSRGNVYLWQAPSWEEIEAAEKKARSVSSF